MGRAPQIPKGLCVWWSRQSAPASAKHSSVQPPNGIRVAFNPHPPVYPTCFSHLEDRERGLPPSVQCSCRCLKVILDM